MNSLRPLITISILGIICLLLYMKINETEPVVPSEVANWDMSSDLGNLDIGGPADSTGGDLANVEIGGPAESLDTTPSVTTQEMGAAPDFSSAPSFDSANTGSVDAMGSAPPAFVLATTPSAPQVTTSAPAFGVATPSTDPSVTVPQQNETAMNSKLPPLPALPAIAVSATAAVDAIASKAKSTGGDLTQQAQSMATGGINNAAQSLAAATTTAANAAGSPTADVGPSFSNLGSDAAIGPTESMEADAKTTAGQASLFSATRLAVQSALDRGELSQALLLLSDWYGDPSLSPDEASEVQGLLSQLAGSVIYSTEHRLEPPYMVQAGEKLEDIAQKYNVPWQLLAKVNGLSGPDQLQPGQQLKVFRGPFSARINLSERKMVVMLDRRYAGQFSIDIEPSSSIEEGTWAVQQKLLTPANVGFVNATSSAAGEERSILLTNTSGGANQVTILRAAGPATPGTTDPTGRVIQLKSADVGDIYDILSLGSQVAIRR